jgi:DNA-binding MarR family transcriptional regulator
MELRRSLETSPLLGLVTLAGRVVGQRWDEVTTRQHGMSAASVSTLLMIAWGTGRSGVADGTPGRARVAELANRLWVRPPTVTGIIDTLVKAGYVRRERDPSDRRAVWVVLTEAGGARVDEIGSELTETFSPAVVVDPEQERIIREFLIALLITYRNRETFDESQRRRPGGRARGRSSEAVPET